MFNMGSAPSLADIAAVTKDGNGDGCKRSDNR